MPSLFNLRSLSRIDSESIDPSELPSITIRHSWNSFANGLQSSTQNNNHEFALVKQRQDKSNQARSSWKTEIEDWTGTHSKQLNLTLNANAKSCPVPYGAGIKSSDSETDLAAMVHEFIENEGHSFDLVEGSDSDHGSPNPVKLRSNLEGTECKGGCVRRLFVKNLRSTGSDASICKLKWQSSGKVPGGEYEYLDVTFNKDCSDEKRLIVDLDFQSQFEIARPTEHYLSTLKLLPAVYIGSSENLDQILQFMSGAARCSLKQNSMHLPPWRTLDYMRAKWHSPCERHTDCFPSTKKRVDFSHSHSLCGSSENNQCLELLRRLKTSLLSVADKGGSPASFSHRRGTGFPRKNKVTKDSCYISHH